MEPIYQCCYTNATQSAGEKAASGWQAVAVTKGTPRDAYDACTRLQNANSTLCTGAMDERGNVLNLYEISGGGSYLYVIRTQFGLSDRLGRPNMFSHAFIFPLLDVRTVLWNPNFYLALNPSVFKNSEVGLRVDERPGYVSSFTLEEAMRAAGIDREKYTILVKCVWAQMSAAGSKPLYVQYGGSELQLRGLLHCICAGIPHYMLKMIHIASSPTANDHMMNVVFTLNAADKGSYLLPQTGENNLLTQRVERKISRWGYIDYAVRTLPLNEVADFFSNLDLIAATLGDPSASNSQILKIAFHFWQQEGQAGLTCGDTELVADLSDALHLPPSGNKPLEGMIKRMLNEVNDRGLRLTPENEALLDTWLSSAKTADLIDAGRVYKKKR